ncbi:hypothetical protein LguiA_006635 [Lonicera macranthoides]
MGDPTNLSPPSLPPGCRFYPSDHQLLCNYLNHKNNGDRRFGFDVIKELDLYDYNPFDLPEITCFRFGRGGRKRHWYCYVAAARVLKERRNRRAAGGGYWKRRGSVRDVVGDGAGKVVVGTRRSFVFYLGDSPKHAVRTDWVMWEYALIDHDKVSFVLCRVFVGSRQRNNINISEQISGSCGEVSVTTVRHVGVQHDGTSMPINTESKLHDNNSLDCENEVLTFPVGLVDEHDQVTREPVGEETRSPGYVSGGTMIVDALTAQQLMTILEEDYIELDDLICPLQGID